MTARSPRPPGPSRRPAPRALAAGAWALAALLGLAALAGAPGISRDEARVLGAADRAEAARAPSAPLAPLLSRAAHAAGAPAGLGHLRSSRLGSALAGALLTALLVGLSWELAGPGGAILAPPLLWLAPRHLQAGLVATPDLLVAALALATVVAYRRASAGASPRRRALAAALVGLLFGGALCARPGAWILLPALGLHAALASLVARRASAAGEDAPRPSPRALLALALLGPALLLAAWPGILRAGSAPWISAAPFPTLPALLPLLAVPGPLLLVYAGGAVHASVRLARALRGRAPARNASDELLLLVLALAPLAALAIAPSPAGARAFLPAVPFLALLGARALLAAAREAWPARAGALAASVSLLVLYPALRATAHFHPFGTAAWNGLAGGAPGAASLGLPRQEGGEAAGALLAAMNERAVPGARVWWPGIDPAAVRIYARDGRLRSDLSAAEGPEAADLAVVALAGGRGGAGRDDEYRVWTEFRTSRPVAGLYLDEVPLAFVYARPGAWR